jgi:hypothetical protein
VKLRSVVQNIRPGKTVRSGLYESIFQHWPRSFMVDRTVGLFIRGTAVDWTFDGGIESESWGSVGRAGWSSEGSLTSRGIAEGDSRGE